MYRVDSIHSDEFGYIELLVYTKSYTRGYGSKLEVVIYDVESMDKQVITADKLYELICDNQVVFGVAVEEYGAKAVTLCSDMVASSYKDFSYDGSYTDLEFYDMLNESNRKKAKMWVKTGSNLALSNKFNRYTGLVELDPVILRNPECIAFYSALSGCETAELNSLTNVLDYFIHCDIGSEAFSDGKRFFLKERKNREYIIH